MTAIETDRCILRNFAPDDWQELQEVVAQHQASDSAHYEPPWPTSAEEVQGIAAHFARGDDFLAVCLKTTGKVIGLVAIGRRKEQEEQVHNLGYVFHPGYHGQGYATESCKAAMGYMFGQFGAEGILTGTHPDNKASVALLMRVGLKAIGEGEFALSRAEWMALSDREDNLHGQTRSRQAADFGGEHSHPPRKGFALR